MAIIGASIGASFMVALVIGPLLEGWIGVPGIFWVTALLAGLGIAIVTLLIPTPIKVYQDSILGDHVTLGMVLRDGQLLRLDIGVFILHMALTSIFVVVPIILRDQFSLAASDHWQVYLSVLTISLLLLVPTIILSEKLNFAKHAFLFAIILCGVGQLIMAWVGNGFVIFFIAMVLFFWGFNFLEASLPSLVSKLSNPSSKGVSMGAFSSSQFLGAFCGGVVAGLIAQNFEQNAVFLFAFVMFLIWFLVALSMRTPVGYKSYTVNLGTLQSSQVDQVMTDLQEFTGVAEVTLIAEKGVAYLRVNKDQFDEDAVNKYAAAFNM